MERCSCSLGVVLLLERCSCSLGVVLLLERCSCILGAVLLQPWSGAPVGAVLLQPWCGAPVGAMLLLERCSCILGAVLLQPWSIRWHPPRGWSSACRSLLGWLMMALQRSCSPARTGRKTLPSHVFPGQNHRGNSTDHLQMTKMGAVKGKSKPAICFLIFLLLAFDLSLCLPKG